MGKELTQFYSVFLVLLLLGGVIFDPHPLKMGIMGGEFQNWVGTSYLTLLNVREMWPSFTYPEKTVNFYEVKSVEPSCTLKMTKSQKKLGRVCAYTPVYTQIREGGGQIWPPPSRIGLRQFPSCCSRTFQGGFCNVWSAYVRNCRNTSWHCQMAEGEDYRSLYIIICGYN